jgi:hypothetical protein
MTVVYLYGFAPADTSLPEGGLLGVGDGEVVLVPGDGFSAVIGAVPTADFAGAGLERNCGDLEWMAAQGLLHEQVIAWFVDHASILPSRFLTLFSSTAALREAMERDSSGIGEGLERFRNMREWDLKIGYDAERLEERLSEVSDEIRELDRAIAAAAPGKAFLLGRKRTDLARTETRAAARRLAAGLLGTLERYAAEVVRLALTSDETPVVLNAALLVDRDREQEALDLAERERLRLEELGVRVQFTGPWAPYRFITEEDSV